MLGTRELTRRIKSIKSTRKITRAMQMVSAAKMRKAQNATLSSRNYAQLAWEMIINLGRGVAVDHPLLKGNSEANKVGVVFISTNRGLVGSFNLNLFSKLGQLEGENSEVLAELIVLGRKAREGALRFGKTISAEFPKSDSYIPVTEIYPLASMLVDTYSKGEYKKIYLLYNHFVSTLTQKATIKQLLPFARDVAEDLRDGPNAGRESEYLFEPEPQKVLNHLLPRIIESQIYQAILESDASEHSARMIMMKNATDAAGDLIDDLTLTYNQLRQNKITTELSEITAGKIALENK